VLDGIGFDVPPGEILGLVGESGSGKSVLMWSIVGLTPPPGRLVAGDVSFGEETMITAGTPDTAALRRVRGSGIGLIVQNARAHLNPLIPIGEQLANVSLAARGGKRADARREAVAMLARVALSDPERIAVSYPHQLSGGMAQRVLIALATINRPRVLLADEPTMGLDVTIQTQVLDLLTEEVRRLGDSALCLVTRDLGVVANYCHTVGVLQAGRLVELSPVREFFAHPRHPHSIALLAAATLADREPELAGSARTEGWR
jgi:ABC-type dipeptide/oligopeptide/nickel transport system ATPase component